MNKLQIEKMIMNKLQIEKMINKIRIKIDNKKRIPKIQTRNNIMEKKRV